MSSNDIDHCGKFPPYGCKDMSEKAVFRYVISRSAQMIAVMDNAREVGIHVLVFRGVAGREFG